jgi:ankyrin repeat protein
MAALSDHSAVLRHLLDLQADVAAAAQDDSTALHLTAEEGHRAAVQQLLAAGADISAATHLGFTALHLAAQFGHSAVVQQLLDADVAAAVVQGGLQLLVLRLAKAMQRLLSCCWQSLRLWVPQPCCKQQLLLLLWMASGKHACRLPQRQPQQQKTQKKVCACCSMRLISQPPMTNRV